MEEGSHSEEGSHTDESNIDGSHADRSYSYSYSYSYSDRSCTSSCYSSEPEYDDHPSVRRRYGYLLPEDFDGISKLPDSILIHILSLLPFSDVIATATLSKRWQFLWKMVPNLVFSQPDDYRKTKTAAMASIIDKALLLHECSRINKFSVEFYYRPKFRFEVDVWLRVATRKNVEEIDLNLRTWRLSYWWYTVPQHLYTNASLVKLTLTYCRIKPKAVVSWPSLKTLSIQDINELNDNLIENILSGCPALESLELFACRDVRKLNIRSASLKKLVIKCCDLRQISAPNVESLSILGFTCRKKMLLNLPSLLCATLKFELRLEGEEDLKKSNTLSGRLMTNLLKTLNGVEEVTMGNWCIQVLSVLEVQNLTSPILSMCKRLILNTKSSKWDIPGMANLLRSSVSLETVVININQSGCCFGEIALKDTDSFRKLYKLDGDLNDKEYWNSQEGALVNSLQRLKTVEIIDSVVDGFPHRREIELVLGLLQVLLKNVRVLEKVVIRTKRNEDGGYLRSMEVAHRLLSFPRASPSVLILVL